MVLKGTLVLALIGAGNDQGAAQTAADLTQTGSAPLALATSVKMARIPAGEFKMGSNHNLDERPVHRVSVAAFEMDLTEVTTAEYQKCVEAGQCTQASTLNTCNAGQTSKQNHPINCVDWNQADTFCRWANKRLPAEEEWEYAARGNDERIYPWGRQDPEGHLCWRRWKNQQGTCEVGYYPSGDSPFGLHDMAGNVWEWTASVFSKGYAKARAGKLRVTRGGSWGEVNPVDFRASGRGRSPPTRRSDVLGFRCAR